jgi:DNA-binding response OmpR family regulator
MKILIVEDEKHLAEAICQILKKQKYLVDITFDGMSGLDYALTNIYDLIILDIMLPKMDGLSVLKEVRNNSITTQILLLTAKGKTADKVKGLDSGADDYLPKPFDKEELLARIRALLRRKNEIIPDHELTFGNITLNHEKQILIGNGHEVDLTKKESDLIEFLMLRKDLLTPQNMLIEKLWGFDSEAEYNNVEVYISLMRKKLTYLDADIIIKTLRGKGYIMEKKDV